jgi:hypothetical protein
MFIYLIVAYFDVLCFRNGLLGRAVVAGGIKESIHLRREGMYHLSFRMYARLF